MNLTGQPPHQKGQERKRNKAPTARDRRYWSIVARVGCIVAGGPTPCRGPTTINHCFTGGGGRKDHAQVIPLCFEHHLGREGIDGRVMSKRAWQDKYGTEASLIELLERRIDHA